jgi:hypothetical protein
MAANWPQTEIPEGRGRKLSRQSDQIDLPVTAAEDSKAV